MAQTFTYLTLDELSSVLAQSVVDEGLTDKTGNLTKAKVFTNIHSTVADDIHFRISPRVGVPFYTNVPAIVKRAALIFAAEIIFERRKVAPKDNPFTQKANEMRERLDKIGAGKSAISSDISELQESVIFISKPSKTTSTFGRLPS